MSNFPLENEDLCTSETAVGTAWQISPSGGIEVHAATLIVGGAHTDHMEMSGRAVNAIVSWHLSEDGQMSITRNVRWPAVRRAQDDTHGSFSFTFESFNDLSMIVDGRVYAPSRTQTIQIDGFFCWEETRGSLAVTRTIFPSTSLPCLLERWEIRNEGDGSVTIEIPREPLDLPQPIDLFKWTPHTVRTEWMGGGKRVLAPGETMICGMVFSCREEGAAPLYPSIEAELGARMAFRDAVYSNLDLQTPDPVVNQLFRFSKLRVAENVLATRGGLMHAPGGFQGYLAALWCNDQNEYASPFFPFLGDEGGNQSAINAYRWFAKYQNDAFLPIPSSIVAEGRGTWEGAGDRGDAAMTASGAARWALATGDEVQARSLWPFIQWCLEYCERQKSDEGVIKSDSDELENRFSSGTTNLATSCLTYDALISASHLAAALGEPDSLTTLYAQRARDLEAAIETVFGATVDGFATYRYHESLETLRAWICFPLVVGINTRASGTVSALFDSNLWTSDGLLTETGTTTRWDRSTLYALRGAFAAGYANEALERLTAYATRRLLGDHVPYCVEAYPEGNQSQLSAESALFCRIFTEGVGGIRPTGFDRFDCTPQLPDAWPELLLRDIRAFGRSWNLRLTRVEGGIEVVVTLADDLEVYRGVKPVGETHAVYLS